MSETAACQWRSLDFRVGAAGFGIREAGTNSKFHRKAGYIIAGDLQWTAVDTLEELSAVGLIDECLVGVRGTRD